MLLAECKVKPYNCFVLVYTLRRLRVGNHRQSSVFVLVATLLDILLHMQLIRSVSSICHRFLLAAPLTKSFATTFRRSLRQSVAMANSRFDYVRSFERDDSLLPNSWIVVRIDGKGFHKFSTVHDYVKPNDQRGMMISLYFENVF